MKSIHRRLCFQYVCNVITSVGNLLHSVSRRFPLPYIYKVCFGRIVFILISPFLLVYPLVPLKRMCTPSFPT